MALLGSLGTEPLREGSVASGRARCGARRVARSQNLVNVVLGAHGLRTPEPTQQEFSVAQVFQNSYDPEDYLNDILLIQLSRPATLDASVATVQLPQQGQSVPHGTQCLAMGWGRLGTHDPAAQVLQELNVTVVTFLCWQHNLCTFVPRRSAGICFVSNLAARPGAAPSGGGRATGLPRPPPGRAALKLCLGLPTWKAGPPNTQRADSTGVDDWPPHILQGDSGGPLICDGVIQGVDSFVIGGCASRLFPDFFARVALYVDWIRSILRRVGAEDSP
ncbi:hypothetical protein P7K49_032713 [Saguinus oedipus]|uniref:Peptidase S1 domain-containing protein n=1 Tax=Saguinus oedipus TaxID=9490 RepID=A0ABQ9TPV6_SAGOE|nr:hypothetical protein P7K49_032713 [Saguinus oedipus]